MVGGAIATTAAAPAAVGAAAPIVAGILVLARLVTLALTAYETLDVLSDLYEGLDKYNKGVDEAKKQLEKLIQDLKDEIDSLVDQKEQVAVLAAAAGVDPQNPTTQRASIPFSRA